MICPVLDTVTVMVLASLTRSTWCPSVPVSENAGAMLTVTSAEKDGDGVPSPRDTAVRTGASRIPSTS